MQEETRNVRKCPERQPGHRFRACAYLNCRHHAALYHTSTGCLKFNPVFFDVRDVDEDGDPTLRDVFDGSAVCCAKEHAALGAHTADAIGAVMGMSHARVSQIEREGLARASRRLSPVDLLGYEAELSPIVAAELARQSVAQNREHSQVRARDRAKRLIVQAQRHDPTYDAWGSVGSRISVKDGYSPATPWALLPAGLRVRRLRQQHGWTRQDVRKATAEPYDARIATGAENGHGNIPLAEVVRIARVTCAVLGIDPRRVLRPTSPGVNRAAYKRTSRINVDRNRDGRLEWLDAAPVVLRGQVIERRRHDLGLSRADVDRAAALDVGATGRVEGSQHSDHERAGVLGVLGLDLDVWLSLPDEVE